MRSGTEVRPARPADLDGLVALCLSARVESGRPVCEVEPAAVAAQLGTYASAAGAGVLVAVSDGVVVGLLLGRVVGPSPFTDEVSYVVEGVYVAAGERRRGVGHALLTAAAREAGGSGAHQMYAASVPGARTMQRFFVRLGFAQVGAHRTTTTTALLRRLTEPRRRGVEEVIARRRRSRDADTQVGLRG